ncbi:neuromodulin isoform X1 [Rhinopithecus roxellana]|nr:neuromodulin isoform X1 [Rhinopithecus roxellana]XP_017711459.1 PREDICTED: neuromodulin isoform X1 [Rhinopithecus bieti]
MGVTALQPSLLDSELGQHWQTLTMTKSCSELSHPALHFLPRLGDLRKNLQSADRPSAHSLGFLTFWLSRVEKNDEDQKIEQDGIKPEDKAHKAATKIQASFRGHITRKKLKGEKKDDAQAAEAEANKKDEAPIADGVEKKGEGTAATEAAPATGSKPDEAGKAGETPSEEKKGEGDAATEQAAPQAPASSEEKAGSAETESATKASTDNSPSSKAEDAPAKEEPKQADVPAAVTAAAATTPAAEDAAAKATAQPPTETGESSQAEENIEAVDETKPKESARQDEGKEEEPEADQEHA